MSGNNKYGGAAAVGTNVYFAPSGMGNVGMLDTTTSTFTTIDTEAAGISGYSKYAFHYDGAVALGGKVYFAPYVQDGIGVVDAASSTFSTIDVAAAGITGSNKYGGAPAVLGTTVYFAPNTQDNVGVLALPAPPSPPPITDSGCVICSRSASRLPKA